MTFLIVTHVPHIISQNQYFAYAPYVKEMNIWLLHATKLIVVAPLQTTEKTPIEMAYQHNNITFVAIKSFSVLNLKEMVKAVFKIPEISFTIFTAMQKADHIHLRCPGNVGLLGCLIQIAFPSKPKTAKYAGNWDPKSPQPWTYKLQKWILSNTFLTKNMQVLVYGKWNDSSKNIKPFFTATYFEKDKTVLADKKWNVAINFIFAGTLVSGKNPLYTIKIIEKLSQNGQDVRLSLFGDGIQKEMLQQYISDNNLRDYIILEGNQDHQTIKAAYQKSHFVILPSESEGWPKVIAEGMFWGCIPLATNVSCVPFMLDNDNRGILLDMNLENDVLKIQSLLKNEIDCKSKSKAAAQWSREFTMDVFDEEIKKLLKV